MAGIRYIKCTANGSTANTSTHIVELEAFDLTLTNVALNKSVTGDPPNRLALSNIVDGNKDSSNYVGLNVGKKSFTVDLGQLYELSNIKVYRYGLDSRSYYEDTVEVSTDGENWDIVGESRTQQYPGNGTFREVAFGIGQVDIAPSTMDNHLSAEFEDGDSVQYTFPTSKPQNFGFVNFGVSSATTLEELDAQFPLGYAGSSETYDTDGYQKFLDIDDYPEYATDLARAFHGYTYKSFAASSSFTMTATRSGSTLTLSSSAGYSRSITYQPGMRAFIQGVASSAGVTNTVEANFTAGTDLFAKFYWDSQTAAAAEGANDDSYKILQIEPVYMQDFGGVEEAPAAPVSNERLLWRLFVNSPSNQSSNLWDLEPSGSTGTGWSNGGTVVTSGVTGVFGGALTAGKWGVFSTGADPLTTNTYNGGWDAGPASGSLDPAVGGRTSVALNAGMFVAVRFSTEVTDITRIYHRTFAGGRADRIPNIMTLQYYDGDLSSTYDSNNWVSYATLNHAQSLAWVRWDITEGSTVNSVNHT